MAISEAPARLMIDITLTVSPNEHFFVAAQDDGLIRASAQRLLKSFFQSIFRNEFFG